MKNTHPSPSLWLTIPYSLFVAVLVLVYWRDYGPTNFLYFCDVALFLALISLWSGNMLWASAACVGILLPQAVWMIDFLGGLIGLPLTGMTAYMFSAELSLFTRALSFFHFWLPLLLLFLLYRHGYDRRAIWVWWPLGTALLFICYAISPPPPAPADNPSLPVNINYVYGLGDDAAQDWLPPDLYFAALVVLMPLVVFWPTHWLLARFMPRPDARR